MEAAAEPRRTPQAAELREEVQHWHACCTWASMVGKHGVPHRTVKYTYSMPWAALAPPFVVNGTSLTVRVHHGTNILPLGARKAARVNAELRASKIRRIDGTELAHDGPNAPGIITNRPAVCEIWSIDGAGSASRHRGQAQRKGESIKDFASFTRTVIKFRDCNRN